MLYVLYSNDVILSGAELPCGVPRSCGPDRGGEGQAGIRADLYCLVYYLVYCLVYCLVGLGAAGHS